MRSHKRSSFAIVLSVLGAAQSAAASPPSAVQPPNAKPTAAAPAPAAARSSTVAAERAAEQALAAHDPDAVARAIESLVKIGGQPAANAIAARLKRGLPPALIEQAIAALGTLGKANTAPVLIELSLHHRPHVRAQALLALGALRARSAEDVLVRGLDDPNLEVRVAAAQALAQAGNARALPSLWAAADRGLDAALPAIGALSRAEDLKPIYERVRTGDLAPITPVLHTLLERSDLSAQAKLGLIDELAKLGSSSARAFLTLSNEGAKKGTDANLQKALTAAIKRIDLQQKGELATAERTPASVSAFVAAHEGAR